MRVVASLLSSPRIRTKARGASVPLLRGISSCQAGQRHLFGNLIMWNKQIGPEFPAAFSGMMARMLAPDRRCLCLGEHVRSMHLAGALGFAEECVRMGFHDKIRFIRVIGAVMNLKIALC